MDGIVVEIDEREDEKYERRRQDDLDAEIARDLINNAKWCRPLGADRLSLEMPNGDRHLVNFDGERWFIVNL